MRNATASNWKEANQRYLTIALANVRQQLEQYVVRMRGDDEPVVKASENNTAMRWNLPIPPALDQISATFSLSPFERDVLLLCAGIELDGRFSSLCAEAQGDPRFTDPCFSLVLAALTGAHWSAITPGGALRHWQLIVAEGRSALTQSRLRIDERILHYLTGLDQVDGRLTGLLRPVETSVALAPSEQVVADRIVTVLRQAQQGSPVPVIQICCPDRTARRRIAEAVCAKLDLRLAALHSLLPTSTTELEGIARLLEREALLTNTVFLIEGEDIGHSESSRTTPLQWLLGRLSCMIFVAARERTEILARPDIVFALSSLPATEQYELWRNYLGPYAERLNGSLERIVAQFNLGAETIRGACTEVSTSLSVDDPHVLAEALWDACRSQARPRLDDLAERVESSVTWDDLVLPPAQCRILRDIVSQVRQRTTVYEAWGFAERSGRGLGISALFSGSSGTGKTMAAEVIANALRLDLYKIDLSQVVSKYIGETEKNLRRIFDAAEAGGAILLFDEADALFGKRSEIRDSHDRHANIEVSYLLQRMESYRGLAILTTNLKHALDSAFLRRIRFVVQFPFPDAVQRAAIWQRIFPVRTPTEGLDVERLARLNVSGGHIRNIALAAAFLAADTGEPVRMPHLLAATRTEYAKLEKSLTEAEVRDWG